MKKIVFIVVLLIGLITYQNTHHQETEQLISLSGLTMGTSYHIKVLADQNTKIDIEKLKVIIDNRLDEINNRMSTYRQDSELSQFNQSEPMRWVPISAELMYVIDSGQRLSVATDGAFDLTVGKLVNSWGFGPTINTAIMPDEETLHLLQQNIGYSKLKLQREPPALLKENNYIYVDLSAIAKGYAVDAVAKTIESKNIHNYLVEIGGEIITQGHKSNREPWVVGIETPIVTARKVEKKLHLNGVAMATSGDYRNYFEQNGIRYSHTIDPCTGYPITHNLASVTVIADNCMVADGLATSFMVMGPEKALEYSEANNIAIFMLIKNGIEFTETYSTAFDKYLHLQPPT